MTAATLENTEVAVTDLPTLRLCTAGSVDDGKSTFVGRLLHDTKSILADQQYVVPCERYLVQLGACSRK